jgi:ectoine hydroxylase-related dioxygenase (phytanoyl-CoA dioxygenase family)
VKEPKTPVPTSWHQDGANWPLHGEEGLTLWIPLDPVTAENGGMKYHAGSHKGQHYGSNTNLVKHGAGAKNTMGPFCPDFDEADPKNVIRWDVKPGDVLIHHMWTAHGATANTSLNVRRRAHTTRWASGTCRFQEGSYRLRQPFEHGLKDGDRLDCKLYPSVPFALEMEAA